MHHHVTHRMVGLLLLVLVLTSAAAAQDPARAAEIARTYVAAAADELGLQRADAASLLVQNAFTNPRSGATHVHLAQHRDGIRIEGAVASVLVLPDGRVAHVGNSLRQAVAARMGPAVASLTALDAIEIAARHQGMVPTEPFRVLEVEPGPEQLTIISEAGISPRPSRAHLQYIELADGQIRLAWRVDIDELGAIHWWSFRIDASTGEVLVQEDLMIPDAMVGIDGATDVLSGLGAHAHVHQPFELEVPAGNLLLPDSYRVFPYPFESPIHGATHTLVHNPINNAPAGTYPAGVNSWHDTTGDGNANFTDTRGNNVNAYLDRTGNGSPDGDRPDGGATLTFDFPIDLTLDPSEYTDGAVVNLFYWTNIVHDLIYQYGFTEAAGNFQVGNFGRGGVEGDPVRAEAQSGAGKANPDVCNAFFSRAVDGVSPTMAMFVCNSATPWRDSDLNAGTVLHEYAHGITIRLTGGAATSSCLSNQEHMGEGWSDWYAIMFTQQVGHTIDTARPYGTYHRNLAVDGPGLRARAYSPDFSVNEFTYDHIKTASVPHGVGHVFATILWDLNWALIGTLFPEEGGASGGGYVPGFNPNQYSGNGANNLALQLVTDALSIQPCSPGFVDARDAILAADVALTGGANERIIWKSFARRGVGFSADQGSPDSRSDGTQAFDMPPTLKNPPVAVAGVDQTIECAGPTGTTASLDGSGSYDLDFLEQTGTGLTYTWTGPFIEGGGSVTGMQVNVTLPPGVHVITLEVADALGLTHSDTVTITVEDTLPPVITLSGVDPQVLECAIDDYIELGATALDQCDGPVAVVIDASDVDLSKVGTYEVIYSATDAAGNSDSETRTVEVEDTTPPEITLAAQPFIIWPPRHQMVSFTRADVVIDATDACNTDLGVDDVVVMEGSSDERELQPGDGSGNTIPDILFADGCADMSLRAERAGTLDGRVYHMLYGANDGYNIGTANFEVHVPHNVTLPAVDSGPVYVVEGCEPVPPVATLLARYGGMVPAGAQSSGATEAPRPLGTVGDSSLPAEYGLSQSFPNPMSSFAEIAYTLPESATVRIAVYDMLGREVRTLIDRQMTAGRHVVSLDATGLPAGTYLYRMEAGTFEQVRRLVIQH